MTHSPQLAETIKFSGLDKYIYDDAWAFEQKLDGVRLMVAVDNGVAKGINRSGGTVGLGYAVAAAFDVFDNGCWLFDGESIGGVFWCFDLVEIGPDPHFSARPYQDRRILLNKIIEDVVVPYTDKVRLLPSFTKPDDKVALMRACIEAHSEGVMAKRLDAPYVHGKRTQTMLKAKLWASADCVVTEVGRGGKRSIGVSVYEEGRTYAPNDKPDVFLGGVTVTDTRLATLNVGDVVEIKYLYATAERKLYQPAFLRMRPDRTPQSCDTSQLKIGDKKILLPTTLPKGI